jgi:protein gp37
VNNISKTIQWADYSWNPIKGLCPVGCWYCYAKGIYNRFKLDPTPRLDMHEINAVRMWADSGKRIFVCSTFDLFHPIADQWRDEIFEAIEYRSDFTFIILTKLPERIDRPMPPNVWLGVSVTGLTDYWRVDELFKHSAVVRFASMEPLLHPVFCIPPVEWLIVGRLTGHGKKSDPGLGTLRLISEKCKEKDVPLFMKSNLSWIYWPERLIQEFPTPKVTS